MQVRLREEQVDDVIQTHNYCIVDAWGEVVYEKTISSKDLFKDGNAFALGKVVKLTPADGEKFDMEDTFILEKCFLAQKNNINYFVPVKYRDYLPIKPIAGPESFEFIKRTTESTVYTYVGKCASVKIPEKKTWGIKEFLNNHFNPAKNTHPVDFFFIKCVAIASLHKRMSVRICGPPECGKNSAWSYMEHFIPRIATVESPSKPRLHKLLAYNDVVLPDELTTLGGEKIKELETYIANVTDMRTKVNKSTLTDDKNLDNIKLNNKSLIFLYNRREDLREGVRFFDDLWFNPGAITSRIPAILVKGKVLTHYPQLSSHRAKELATKHVDYLREVCMNMTYYINNIEKEMHGYNRDMVPFVGRHLANTQAIFDVLDVASDTQQEFDAWCDWVKGRVDMYGAVNKEM